MRVDDWDNWDGTIEGIPCHCGGLGSYVLLDHHCDWECQVREACLKVKKQIEQKRQGEIWRKLFYVEELSDDERSYRELIGLLFPNGKCETFLTCTHPDKDDYYCHTFCPWVPSLDQWIEELQEMRRSF